MDITASGLSCLPVAHEDLLTTDPIILKVKRYGEAIAAQRRELARNLSPDRNSQTFRQAIIPFQRELWHYRNYCRPLTEALAETIRLASRPGDPADDMTGYRYYALAVATRNLGSHPQMEKNVAALIRDKTNHLLAHDVNRVPDQAPLFPEMFMEGKSSAFVVCAEGNAVARLLGVQMPENLRHGIPVAAKKECLAFIAGKIEDFSREIQVAAYQRRLTRRGAKGSYELSQDILTTSDICCKTCKQKIRAYGFDTIETAYRANPLFSRATEMTDHGFGRKTAVRPVILPSSHPRHYAQT